MVCSRTSVFLAISKPGPNPIPEQFNEFLRCCFFFRHIGSFGCLLIPICVYSIVMRECYAETFSILLRVLLRKVPRYGDRGIRLYVWKIDVWDCEHAYMDTTETIAIFLRHIKCEQVNFGVFSVFSVCFCFLFKLIYWKECPFYVWGENGYSTLYIYLQKERNEHPFWLWLIWAGPEKLLCRLYWWQ